MFLIDNKQGTLQEVLDIQNRYLKTEKAQFGTAAQMATKWIDIQQKADKFYLKYLTAGDKSVRKEHAKLDGIILPAEDSFWNKYLPPNGHNCRCDVVMVSKKTNSPANSNNAMQLGEQATLGKDAEFRYNAGITGETYSTTHPYFSVTNKPEIIVKQALNVSNTYGKATTIEEAVNEIVFSNYRHLYNFDSKGTKLNYSSTGTNKLSTLAIANNSTVETIVTNNALQFTPPSNFAGASFNLNDIELLFKTEANQIIMVDALSNAKFKITAKKGVKLIDVLKAKVNNRTFAQNYKVIARELNSKGMSPEENEIRNAHAIMLQLANMYNNYLSYTKY